MYLAVLFLMRWFLNMFVYQQIEEANCIWIKENKWMKTTKEEDVFLPEWGKRVGVKIMPHTSHFPIHQSSTLPLLSHLIHPSVNINKKWIAAQKCKNIKKVKLTFPQTHLSYFSTIIYISLKGFCISRFKEDIRSFTTCPEFIYFKQVFIRCQDINLKIF